MDAGRVDYYYLSYDYLGEIFGIQAYYLSLFYLIGCFFIIKRIDKIRLGHFCLLFLWLCIFLLASRMTIILSLFAIPYYLYTTLGNKRLLFWLGLIGISLFAVAYFFNPILKERINIEEDSYSNYSGFNFRMEIWKNAYHVFQESPIIGYGMQNANDKLIEQYEKTSFRAAYRNNYHAHNQFVQTSLNSGLIGLLLLVAIVISVCYNLHKRNHTVYLISFVCLIMSMITESIFQRQWGLFLFAFFVGISIIRPANEKGFDYICESDSK